jgi:hypothetical protein
VLDGMEALRPKPGGPPLLAADPFAGPKVRIVPGTAGALARGPAAGPAAPASGTAPDPAVLRPRRRRIPQLAELVRRRPPACSSASAMTTSAGAWYLQHLLEDGSAYDRFGLSRPRCAARSRSSWRCTVLVPRAQPRRGEPAAAGGAVLAANRRPALDGAMLALDVLRANPPRLARRGRSLGWHAAVAERVLRARRTRDRHRENVAGLLDNEQLVLVFPEGMDGIRKLPQAPGGAEVPRRLRGGLRARVPIVRWR